MAQDMDGDAELVWTEELLRRQEAHIVEVWRLLRAWPRGAPVALRYGSDREATGAIAALTGDMVQLSLNDGGTRWVPLLQVDAIDSVELATAARLPRPKVDGVIEVEVAKG